MITLCIRPIDFHIDIQNSSAIPGDKHDLCSEEHRFDHNITDHRPLFQSVRGI